jgi:2-oxoisovalerate dehydrogenase E2 component (dihydrolipoyl transacylase)
MKIFTLPDLGEGLQEAEICAWHVAENDDVEVDQPLLSVETEKAVVEIPSPRAGKIGRLFVKPGDILAVGDPLVEFTDGDAAERSGAAPDEARPAPQTAPGRPRGGDAWRESAVASGAGATAPTFDRGTVVGRVESGAEVTRETATSSERRGGGVVRATPAVRALARRLEVDLGVVTPTGPSDTITARDIERVAKLLKEVGPLEPLRGVRRAMARSMTQAHAEVAPVTVSDDADLAAWWPARRDLMLRLIRAIAAACKVEPALNAWFDSHAIGRRVLPKVHLGIAVDTGDGLFVPVLRDVGNRAPEDLASGLERLRRDVEARTIPPEEMRGYTFTLSNFGTFGGRYANPIVQPPTVAILGAGRIRDQVVAAGGQPAVHPVLPLSLTFDHRAVTGGEATRFLAAVIADLEAG